jgi:molybdopterin synthase catalytic subunit
MKVLGVAGDGAADCIATLAPRLDGSVATVEALPTVGTDGGAVDLRGGPGVATPETEAAYGLGTDGSWVGAGADRSLDETLDEFAPRYDYALVAGFPDARLPTVALGGADPLGETVATAADPDEVDYAAVVAAIEDLAPRVTLEALVRRATASPMADRAGAVATFTGRVRAKDDPDDARTTHLEFESYEGVADERMATIRDDLTDREGVFEVLLHHRTGVVADGEDIVFVVVLAGHRREAFRTVEDGIDRLKDEVPIFKKEVTVEDEFWSHDRP